MANKFITTQVWIFQNLGKKIFEVEYTWNQEKWNGLLDSKFLVTNSDGCRRPENTSNRPPSEMAKPRTNIAHHVLTACSTRQAGSNSVNVQDVCCLCVTARTVIRIGCVTITQQGESVCWLCDCHTTLTTTRVGHRVDRMVVWHPHNGLRYTFSLQQNDCWLCEGHTLYNKNVSFVWWSHCTDKMF